MPEKKEKINWPDVVTKSNGKMVFLPEGFHQAQKELNEGDAEYNKRVVEMAKQEITSNMAQQQIWFQLRQYLEKNGYKDIWIKQLGFNQVAMRDGQFIVNILDQKPQMPEM